MRRTSNVPDLDVYAALRAYMAAVQNEAAATSPEEEVALRQETDRARLAYQNVFHAFMLRLPAVTLMSRGRPSSDNSDESDDASG